MIQFTKLIKVGSSCNMQSEFVPFDGLFILVLMPKKKMKVFVTSQKKVLGSSVELQRQLRSPFHLSNLLTFMEVSNFHTFNLETQCNLCHWLTSPTEKYSRHLGCLTSEPCSHSAAACQVLCICAVLHSKGCTAEMDQA